MDENMIYDIIENHSNKDERLFLLDAPTGFGKTYNIIKYIQNHYKDKKIFLIANQLKLLPSEDKIIEGLNNEEANNLKDNLLYLRSYLDSFLLNFKNSYENMDDEFIQINNKLLNELKSLIENINKEKDKQIKQIFYDKFTTTEYEFRKQVKVFLKSKEYKKREIVKIKWLTDLYPAILLEKKQVILLSTKKFFLPIDIIYEGSILLYNKKFDNSILFIDEFDATKQVLLDTIIENATGNYKVDCFRLFRLLQNTFDKKILKEYTKSWNNEKVTMIVENLSNLFLETNKSFQELLNYPFKVKDDSFITKHFIFNDNITLSISKDTDLTQFYTYFDKKDRFNYIVKSKAKDSSLNNCKRLDEICQKVINCIDEFCEKMTFVVEGYLIYIEENKNDLDSDFANQDGCTTVIDFLNIGEENKKFLVDRILGSYTEVLKFQKYIFEDLNLPLHEKSKNYNFYQNGFSYLEIKDDSEHNLESKCYLFSYNLTPEKLIISTAINYHVIGVSATSSYKSSLVNYDLEYLKNTLNISNLFTDEFEQARIKKSYNQRNEIIYKNTEIKIKFVSGDEEFDYLNNIWNQIFGNNHKELLETHRNQLNQNKYLYKVIANLYKVFYEFIQDDSMSSFIYFLTFNLYNRRNIHELVKVVFYKMIDKDEEIEYEIIDSMDFEKKYKDIKEKKLEKGKKVFLITTYQTIGAGINLQYLVTYENIKRAPHLKIGEERDYDGIYLSKPTNIMPSLKKSYFDYISLAHSIYAIEYLKVSRELQPDRFKRNINNLFKSALLNQETRYYLLPYHNYNSICLGAAKVLAQATGRICRTKQKNSIVNIYVDEEITNYLYSVLDVLKNQNNNFEFNKILENITKENLKPDVIKIFELKEKNRLSNAHIWDFLKSFSNWPKEKMNEWRKLRKNVLKYPTCNNLQQHSYVECYFEFDQPINEYSYSKSWKYLQDVSLEMNKHPYKMSADACGLTIALSSIPKLKDHFINLGYATNFEKNTYILSVDLYHRIYKGALGEEIGKFILSSYEINLKDIENPDHFERFDYYYNNVYFDFKNWSEDFLIPESQQVIKTINKAKKIGTKRVFVINVLDQNYKKEQTFNIDGVKLTTIPYLCNISTGEINKKMIAKIKMAIEKY